MSMSHILCHIYYVTIFSGYFYNLQRVLIIGDGLNEDAAGP